jgi:hypothetical protein
LLSVLTATEEELVDHALLTPEQAREFKLACEAVPDMKQPQQEQGQEQEQGSAEGADSAGEEKQRNANADEQQM